MSPIRLALIFAFLGIVVFAATTDAQWDSLWKDKPPYGPWDRRRTRGISDWDKFVNEIVEQNQEKQPEKHIDCVLITTDSGDETFEFRKSLDVIHIRLDFERNTWGKSVLP